MTSQFRTDPRSFALELVEEGLVDPTTMLQVLLGYMSHDEIREALDLNELSPRFAEDADEDTEAEGEDAPEASE